MNLITKIAHRYQKFFIWILMVFCIAVGLSIASDYGLSWDEPLSHYNGQVALHYVRDGDPALWESSERYYGTVFEMPFAFVEETVGFVSAQELFVFRHQVTFLLFLCGVLAFYLLCLKRFQSRGLPLLGAIFLLVSPRIFADSFYNSKDIPVLVLFIVSIFTLFRLLERPTFLNIVWHALASALLIAIRLPGIFIPAITLGFIVVNMTFLPEQRAAWRKLLVFVLSYMALTAGLVVVFWPFLWQNPVTHFIESLADMSRFSRQMSMQVLYFGKFVSASELPWHYIPVWILITTPLAYTVFFLIGVGTVVQSFFRNFFETLRTRKEDLIVLCWFFGPLSAVIVLHSVLYDGWRHLYFIYPALIYLSLVGLNEVVIFLKKFDLETQTMSWRALAAVVTLNLILVFSFMVRNHPYQHLYFNILAGGEESARKNFDMDYWGLTFREGLEYIAEHDSDILIPIYFAGGSSDNVLILAPDILNRFVTQKDISQAKYVLSNYRWQEYDMLPFDKEFYAVRVDTTKVMSIFKMRQ